MAHQIGIRRRGVLTTRLRKFEDIITVDGLLVLLHASSRRKAMVTDIAGEWFLVSVLELCVHAECKEGKDDSAETVEEMG